MNNKHDANVRKSTLVNFQLGLIVALLITVFVMEIKTATPIYGQNTVLIEEDPVEVYFNPEYTIIKKENPVKKIIRDVKPIIDVIDVIDNETPDFLDEPKDLVTTTPDVEVNPTDIVEIIDEAPVAPVPFVAVEFVPIFPGCEGLATNDERRDCMSSKINNIVQRKFDGDLGADLGLSGQQRIYVRFSIDEQGKVTKVQGRSSHPQLTKEGERMAALIPNMQPGKQSGKPVEVIFDLPIVFNVKD